MREKKKVEEEWATNAKQGVEEGSEGEWMKIKNRKKKRRQGRQQEKRRG